MQALPRFRLGIRSFFVATMLLCGATLLAMSIVTVIYNLMQTRRIDFADAGDTTPANEHSKQVIALIYSSLLLPFTE